MAATAAGYLDNANHGSQDELERAFVDWVNSLELSHRHCTDIRDLVAPDYFSEILAKIDANWFKTGRVNSIDSGDNWVLRFNAFKRLHKLLVSFYAQVLGQDPGHLRPPNLTAIARDSDPHEILYFGQLVLAAAVQCTDNQKYVVKIQSLDQEAQHALMLAIENVMASLANPTREAFRPLSMHEGDLDTTVATTLMFQKGELEKQNKELSEELESVKGEYTSLRKSKVDLEGRLSEMELAMSRLKDAGQVDFILRNEIETLRADLSKNEHRRLESEAIAEKQANLIADLTRKIEEATTKAEEADRLKDTLDEFRNMADKLQKAEAIIEKYKRRFEEVGDLRRQLKVAEETSRHQTLRGVQIEEEFRKVAGVRSQVDALKEQISILEGRNSSLQVENETLTYQLKEFHTKADRYEVEKRSDEEHIQALEERLKEMEFRSGGFPIEEHGASETESQLRTKIARLEREVETLRQKSAAQDSLSDLSSKVTFLETLLTEANALKSKFEHDHREVHERNQILEDELIQLRSLSEVHSTSQVASYERQIADLESKVRQLQSQAQPRRSSTSAAPSHHEEIRTAIGMRNKALQEKEELAQQLAEAKNLQAQQARVISELKSSLAGMEVNGQSSDETVRDLANTAKSYTEALDKSAELHLALKQAKDHIRKQEERIKALMLKQSPGNNAPDFTEAIASLERTIQDRTAEIGKLRQELSDTRAEARREQQAMSSAWYNMVLESQIKGSGSRGGMTISSPQTPKSWLAKERLKIFDRRD
ncbi:HOOK protein-domain-containing protein [Gaertneriomyces semiglobifer]|nr:HOOK protein-domain-containing protein [Gaertneriomyces semiglobifer]